MKIWYRMVLAGGLIALVALPVYMWRTSPGPRAEGDTVVDAVAHYVGYRACVECHQEAYEAWMGSDHERAMDVATDETVLGDFNNITFVRHDGKSTRFFREGAKFMVETEGPDGQPGRFEVTHVFGHDPLQQYLVSFPGGRMQCLTIAWDRLRGAWYDLYAGQDIPAGDWLHWTGRAQTWNTMCAECHSTNLKKNYDPVADTYQTTWTDIHVSCEACHGPGSAHVAWSKKTPERRDEEPAQGLVVQTSGLTAEQFVNQCALCHARRQTFHDVAPGNREFLDHATPALYQEGVYFADGQILDENYVYGSYVQSKMYHLGIRCSDCHDVHSLQLRAPGNQLCAQCHIPSVYDTPSHHFHQRVVNGQPNPGAQCVSCHMPERVYMGIDWRADHSIRVPRPDLTEATGSPDACSRCHDDQPLSFSVDAFKRWYGDQKKPHFGTVLAKARAGDPEALDDVVVHAQDRLLPELVRASLLAEVVRYVDDMATGALQAGLSDERPLVRRTAVEGLSSTGLPAKALIDALVPLLDDPVLGVRIAVVPALAAFYNTLDESPRVLFERVKEEYVQATAYTADMPASRLNLGNLALALGDLVEAEEHYRRALRLDDRYVPAAMNLALLLNRQGRNAEARALLEQVVADNPGFGEAAFSLGLLLAELRDYAAALEALRAAARLMPDHARVHYNLGQLADFQGEQAEATEALEQAVALAPHEPSYWGALAEFYLRHRRLEDAVRILDAVETNHPGSALLQRVGLAVEQLRASGGGKD